MLRRIKILMLLLVPIVSVTAQSAKGTMVNQAVSATTITSLNLPARVDEISFIDGKLHLSANGMLFAVREINGMMGFPEIDTFMNAIDPQLTYAVYHQATGEVYFTKPDSKGVSRLYVQYEKKPGKFAVKKVNPSGFSFSIDHPVFSPDGRAMIFSSDCPLGFGGLDLWYSEMKFGEWQYPQNLGHNINTVDDEISPVMYGDFLIYSSNGRKEKVGGFDLYSSRLVAEKQTGDTVVMYPIGRCRSYSLQEPFCTSDDDVAIAFNADGSGGWWISRNAEGVDEFHAFKGRMDCVRLSGSVSNIDGSAVGDAKVTVRQKGMGDVTVTVDKEGKYCLFLQEREDYELYFQAPDHFVSRHEVNVSREDEENLYYTLTYNVELQAIAIGSELRYDDLFSSSVSSELSPSGRKRIDTLARFMKDNPDLKISVVSAYNQSQDKPFCTLLNNSRLRSLTDYLVSKGVPLTSINAEVSSEVGKEQSSEGVSPAVASSRTVSFRFSH